ncbi:hypothetical protein CSOJ01_13574 [Colletotrichum sojae]|uniref:Uncharacterized protein n=1 Tax=Colletotrichum sojae TaxID=2175907 RepID=A0A8H6ML67_9PEZI|nr:hypothetical protein CSOJ01_13574 [Colletotrichum sojae]
MEQPLRSEASPVSGRLSADVKFLIMEATETASDLLAWILISRSHFDIFVSHKAAILARHLDLNLLSEALAILRLRRLHDARDPGVPVYSCRHLVDVAVECLREIGPRSPRSLIPEDFSTIVELLSLVDEVNCIVPGVIQTEKNRGHRWQTAAETLSWFLPPTSGRDRQVPSLPACGTREMYSRQREVLIFELYVQALFRDQNPVDSVLNEAGFERLAEATGMTPEKDDDLSELSTPSFYWTYEFIGRLSKAYLDSASRRVIRIDSMDDRPAVALALDTTSPEPAPSLSEALDDPAVLLSSGYSRGHAMVIHEVETLVARKAIGSRPTPFSYFNFTGSKVRAWHTAEEKTSLYRIVCKPDSGEPYGCGKAEYLCKMDDDRPTALRRLVTREGREGWRATEKLDNLLRMVSGGIRPFVRLVHMSHENRDRHLADNFVRESPESFCPARLVDDSIEPRSALLIPLEVYDEHMLGETSPPEVFELSPW